MIIRKKNKGKSLIRAVSVCSNVGGVLDDGMIEKCQILGRLLAQKGIVVVNGACRGYSYEVIHACYAAGGVTLGVSPAENFTDHKIKYGLPEEGYTVIVYTGFGYKGRNVIMTRSGQAGIFIGGGMGTLNEFTIMHDEGKKLAILEGAGGTMDLIELIQHKNYKSNADVIRVADPQQLLERLLSED